MPYLPNGLEVREQGRKSRDRRKRTKKRSCGDKRAGVGHRGCRPEAATAWTGLLLRPDGAPLVSQLTPQLTDRQA